MRVVWGRYYLQCGRCGKVGGLKSKYDMEQRGSAFWIGDRRLRCPKCNSLKMAPVCPMCLAVGRRIPASTYMDHGTRLVDNVCAFHEWLCVRESDKEFSHRSFEETCRILPIRKSDIPDRETVASNALVSMKWGDWLKMLEFSGPRPS